MSGKRQKRLIQLLLVLLVLLGVAMLAVGLKWRAAHQMAVEEKARAMEQVRLGGPFRLIDHNGRAVTEADYQGKFLLLFFGYTSCPDVCPLTLQNISEALDLLGPETARLAPLFISVDPDRDSPQVIADYLSNFNPAIVGLTGSTEQLAAIARAYGIYFEKIEMDDSGDSETRGAHESHMAHEDYYMNHSSMSLLMAPDGFYVTNFPLGTGPEVIAAKVAEALEQER